jgi:methionyl-tRNA formyltransferase
MTYILVSAKPWHDELFEVLSRRVGENWIRIRTQEAFAIENLNRIDPDRIFIPHWSHLIPPEIYDRYECIVFHMTDLPYGRGGSPLQNLIIRGHDWTKISAIRVAEGIDTGKVYLKKDLPLYGTAEEIFMRSAEIIALMINELIEQNIQPVPQEGEVVEFKRRTPEDGNLEVVGTIDRIYDMIRMLDCPGYPRAYLETDHFKFEFERASLKHDKTIKADVRIVQK